MQLRMLMVFSAVLSLASCQIGGIAVSSITPEVRNAIAYCNGGIDSDTALKINAALEQKGGSVTATLSDRLAGVFLSRPGITEANAVAAQKQYMECLDKRAVIDKKSSVDTCEAKLRCEIDTLQMACNCRTTVLMIAAEQKLPEATKNQLLAKECYSGQYGLPKCWPSGANVNSERAVCSVVVQNAGRELPVAKAGTCLATKG